MVILVVVVILVATVVVAVEEVVVVVGEGMMKNGYISSNMAVITRKAEGKSTGSSGKKIVEIVVVGR